MIRLIVVLAVLAAGAAATIAPPAWSRPEESRFDEAIQKFFKSKGRSPPHSLAVALVRDGRLVMARGYGESAPGTPATEETIYHVGSLTKQFTAAAILQLIDEGAVGQRTGRPISLEEDVSLVLPGFEHWSRGREDVITIRRLLNMTSNLPNFTRRPPKTADPWGAVGSTELLGAIQSYSPHGWPNSFEYSNTSYFLLAEIIEASVPAAGGQISGYKERLKAVFRKAGMTSTGFFRDVGAMEPLAKPHYDRRPVFIKGDWLKGSGDMVSTALDLFQWNKALMEGRIVRPELRERMFADGGRIGPASWYGMGFFVEHKQGRDEFTHTGSVPGYASFNGLFRTTPSGAWAGVTLLTNSGGLEGLEVLGSDLADLLLAE